MTDWDGQEYRRVNGLQQWLADRAIGELNLTGVHHVLDIGCGDGRITAEIAARIPDGSVVGVDPSPRMIGIAPTAPNLTFEQGDVLGLSYQSEFDLVTSFNALHWVADQGGALRRIRAAMTTSARAMLVFVCAGDRPSLEDIAMATATDQRWAHYFADFAEPFVHPDPRVWEELVRGVGLRVDDLRIDDLDWDFGARDTFLRWCTVGFGAWTSRLPMEAVDDFVRDVVVEYKKLTGSDSVFRFMQLRATLTRPLA